MRLINFNFIINCLGLPITAFDTCYFRRGVSFAEPQHSLVSSDDVLLVTTLPTPKRL